jgi:tetratricopeptide (TPR) repeat protein
VLAGQLQDEDLQAQAEHDLGMLDGLRGNREEASARLRRALHLRLALREQEYAAMSLDELALLAAADGATEPAIELYAAAAALRSRAGTPQAPAYRARHDPVLDRLRTAAGDRFTAVWAQGTRQPPAHYANPR